MPVLKTPEKPFILPDPLINGIALYVHWPWCLKKCPYCDFNAHVDPSRDVEGYFTCVLNELNYFAHHVSNRSLISIFFGGGTPSLASPNHIAQVIHAARVLFPPTTQLTDEITPIEITLEVNPATYRPEMFHEFVNAGVTRFSIGVQSLDPDELSFLGRAHNEDEALRTIDMALMSGAEVNTDFIYGLPEQSLEKWGRQLHAITALGTHHVSAYQLTIEPQTKFFAEVNKQQWQPLDADRQADFYLATQATLNAQGLQQYEISNFARSDVNNHLLACRHNLHVWRYGDYLGLGAGAHGRVTRTKESQLRSLIMNPLAQENGSTKSTTSSNLSDSCGRLQAPTISSSSFKHHKALPLTGKVATRNFKMPETYMSEITDKNHALYEEICLSPSEAAQEAILNGLRLPDGVYVLKGDKDAQKSLSQSHFDWPEVEALAKRYMLKIVPDAYGYQITILAAGQLVLDSILEKVCRSSEVAEVHI